MLLLALVSGFRGRRLVDVAMSLFVFGVLPLAWFFTGRLLKPAVVLTFPSQRGKRLGAALGRWCPWVFPTAYLLLFLLGSSGDAGHGVFLFGSQELFGVLGASFYAVPVLVIYVIGAMVFRDLVRGVRWLRS
jgi:hypothetical protein